LTNSLPEFKTTYDIADFGSAGNFLFVREAKVEFFR
jgi:hypothetical protein